MRILCIVPTGHEADYLLKGLRELAYRVDLAHDLADALFHCSESPYDALIVALEGIDEREIEPLHAAGAPAALLVIASEDSSALRTRILRAGAQVCLSRPWSFIELQARLQALERRAESNAAAASNPTSVRVATPASASLGVNASAASTLPHGGAAARSMSFRLDSASRSLIAAHLSVSLSRREYLVLEHLMRELNAVVSRDQLLDYAWTPDEHADASTVNTLISRLRAKLQAAGVNLPLDTVMGHGYRFTAR